MYILVYALIEYKLSCNSQKIKAHRRQNSLKNSYGNVHLCGNLWNYLYSAKSTGNNFCELLAKIIFKTLGFLKINPIISHQEHHKSKCWQNTKLGEQRLFSVRLNKHNGNYNKLMINKSTVKMQWYYLCTYYKSRLSHLKVVLLESSLEYIKKILQFSLKYKWGKN